MPPRLQAKGIASTRALAKPFPSGMRCTIGNRITSIIAAVAVLLIHIDSVAATSMMPASTREGLLPVRWRIHAAMRRSSRYLTIDAESTKPPRNSRMMSLKNGLRKACLRGASRASEASIAGRSHVTCRNTTTKLVTKSGIASPIHRIAVTRRISSATPCAWFKPNQSSGSWSRLSIATRAIGSTVPKSSLGPGRRRRAEAGMCRTRRDPKGELS